jgi:hypothetical protein
LFKHEALSDARAPGKESMVAHQKGRLGSHVHNSILFLQFNEIGLFLLTSFFPHQNKKAWLRFFECQAFLGFPPPSSPPEKMVNVTLGNSSSKQFDIFPYLTKSI